MSGKLLTNGLIYGGSYNFQQVAPPSLGSAKGGAGTVTVRFGGAAPLAGEFCRKIRQLRWPAIIDNGVLGSYNTAVILAKLFTGLSVSDGQVWTFVELKFDVPISDTPAARLEDMKDEGFSLQTVRVTGPGKSYYEATYRAPQTIHRWTSNSKPSGPRTNFAGSQDILIIRDRLVTDPGAGSADLTPVRSTRVDDYQSLERISGQLWENTSTVSKVLLDEDRSGTA